jgi:hypothetical protein
MVSRIIIVLTVAIRVITIVNTIISLIPVGAEVGQEASVAQRSCKEKYENNREIWKIEEYRENCGKVCESCKEVRKGKYMKAAWKT